MGFTEIDTVRVKHAPSGFLSVIFNLQGDFNTLIRFFEFKNCFRFSSGHYLYQCLTIILL